MLLSLLVLDITIAPSSINCRFRSRREFWTGDLTHLLGLSASFSSEELESLSLESELLLSEGDLSGVVEGSIARTD
jgi:hypothetical protein